MHPQTAASGAAKTRRMFAEAYQGRTHVPDVWHNQEAIAESSEAAIRSTANDATSVYFSTIVSDHATAEVRTLVQ